MGWFGKIVLGIIILGALAILADVITWIYEVAWIIPIIIVLVVGFFCLEEIACSQEDENETAGKGCTC